MKRIIGVDEDNYNYRYEEKEEPLADHALLCAGWQTLTQGLPEVGIKILVLNKKGEIFIDSWPGVSEYISNREDVLRHLATGEWLSTGFKRHGDITHWMPLPEKPTGI